MNKTIGKTKDAGYQFGIRKTFPISVENAWDFMISKKGIKVWLGQTDNHLVARSPFRTEDGIFGVIRIFKPYSHIRMNWKKEEWKNISTLQVRLIKNNSKTTISFHHEKLENSEQREEIKKHWNSVMDDLETIL